MALQIKADEGGYTDVFHLLNRNPMLVVATTKEITGYDPQREKRKFHETLGRVLVKHAQKEGEEQIVEAEPQTTNDSD